MWKTMLVCLTFSANMVYNIRKYVLRNVNRFLKSKISCALFKCGQSRYLYVFFVHILNKKYMKTTHMLLITAVAVVINLSSAFGAEVIVNYKNPIVLDTNYQTQEDQSLIMDVELSTQSLRTYSVQGIKIQDATPNQLVKDGSLISLYDLRFFSVLVNGKEINTRDSLTPDDQFIGANFIFAAGSFLQIKAKFPDGVKGILKIKIKLYFQEFEKPVYEHFEFIQNIYAGVQPETTSSTNWELDKIIMCQNMADRVITLKNFPMGNTLKVYNLQGILIYESKEAKLEESINFKKLPKGIFIISIGDTIYKKIAI